MGWWLATQAQRLQRYLGRCINGCGKVTQVFLHPGKQGVGGGMQATGKLSLSLSSSHYLSLFLSLCLSLCSKLSVVRAVYDTKCPSD